MVSGWAEVPNLAADEVEGLFNCVLVPEGCVAEVLAAFRGEKFRMGGAGLSCTKKKKKISVDSILSKKLVSCNEHTEVVGDG